jgi:hypothetical protein
MWCKGWTMTMDDAGEGQPSTSLEPMCHMESMLKKREGQMGSPTVDGDDLVCSHCQMTPCQHHHMGFMAGDVGGRQLLWMHCEWVVVMWKLVC